jgi:hypothetical protein
MTSAVDTAKTIDSLEEDNDEFYDAAESFDDQTAVPVNQIPVSGIRRASESTLSSDAKVEIAKDFALGAKTEPQPNRREAVAAKYQRISIIEETIIQQKELLSVDTTISITATTLTESSSGPKKTPSITVSPSSPVKTANVTVEPIPRRSSKSSTLSRMLSDPSCSPTPSTIGRAMNDVISEVTDRNEDRITVRDEITPLKGFCHVLA